MFFIFPGTTVVLITLIYPRAFTQEIYVSPFIYDVQHKDYVTIHIKGLASTFDMIKWTNCNIMDLESRILMKANLTYDDSSVLARFYTPSSLGAFKIQCSKYDTQLNFDGNFLLVNSLYLLIQNVEPSTISLGESVSLKLEVFNLTEPVPLLCHLSDNDDYVVLPTNSINGNKLSTWITCPKHQFTKAAEYRVTVVYSLDAIESILNMNNFKTVAVHASRPKLIKSGYTKDLRTLWLQFDQNVEGPESCNEIFTHYTMTQLGYDAICWFSSDHLTVLLGNITDIKDNRFIIQFSANNAIRSYRSWPQYSSTMLSHEIIVPITPSEVTLPRYWLHGPQYYCGNPKNNLSYEDNSSQFTIDDNNCLGPKTITVSPMSSLLLKYNTILSVNDYSNSAMMSPEEASQRNYMLRNSVKDLVKAVKRQNLGTGICLNGNMMLSNVMYTLEITGTNILYQSGLKAQLQFKLAETQNNKVELKLQIITRPSYATGTEAVFETTLYSTCDELDNDLYDNLQYEWYIVADGIKRNIIGINAPTLILDTKELTHNYNYTVGCDLRGEIKVNNIKVPVIAKDETKFGIEPFDAKAIIIPQQLVISFGRSTRLKVTHGVFSRKENIQYKWLCKTIKGDDCLMVGNYPELKAALDQTGSSELTIREVTLQPGRYYFVVQISLSGVPIDSAVSVLVVSYESGPHISFYWPDKNFNPSVPFSAGKSFSIAATVSYLISGCLATWSTSADTGYTYLTSKYMGGKDKILEEFMPSRNKNFSRNVRLTMTLPNNVKYNTNYLIKLNIHCDSLKHPIFSILPISIIASPMISELKVDPIEGIGLTTVFRFQTIPAYDTKSSHPIQYSFGYYVPSLLSKPIYFYSSSYWLKTEYLLPSVNSSKTRIKTVLRACNIYKSCSITEGPDVIIYQPTQISNSDLTKYSSKFKSMLELQMVGESEAYIFSVTGTLRLYDHSKYQQFTEKISDVIAEFINDNLLKSLSRRTEYLPISLTYMESFTRTLPILFKFNNILLQSLLLLRDTIYTIMTTADNLPTSLNIITDIKYIIQNFNSINQLIYSNTEINSKIIELLLRVSETAIMNYDNESDGLNEKKKILENIYKYSKQICLTLNEREEMYVGSLVGSFSVQHVNSLRTLDSYMEVPTCSSDLYKKCIKQKLKVMYDDSFFHKVLSTKSQFCMVGIHFYDDFFTQIYGSKGVKLKRHSSIYGYRILKINNMKELLTNEETNEFPSSLHVIEIPLESKSENFYECRYWQDTHGWSNESCTFLGIINKGLSNYVKCECPVLKFYGIFSAVYQIPLDSFASETAHNSIAHDKQKNQLNNSSKMLSQRSLNDVFVAFSINGNPADLYDQNLETLENSLSQQLTEKIESLSAIMKGLKIILNEPVYIALHLIQTTNITTDEPIEILAKKLNDRSLILYDLHRSRLNVPEQPLRIIQPRDKEVNDLGKPIAMFFAIFVSFLACFVFGSILIKRHQIVTDVSDIQQNVNQNGSMKRPKYKQLETTELIEQHSNCEQRYRHFSTNVELSDSGITLHSDRTQINLLQKLH